MLKIENDFLKDENTRLCPGKKDYLKFKEGKVQQKRVFYQVASNIFKHRKLQYKFSCFLRF